MLGTDLAPWDLAELPDEWVTAMEMWIYDLPRARSWRAQIEASMEKLRERNRKEK